MASARFVGQVRSFRGQWGFLNSDQYEGDLFVGLKSNPHLLTLKQDDQVEFDVITNQLGKAEAVSVTVLSSKGQAQPPMPQQALLHASHAMAQMGGGATDVSGLVGHQLVGRIKTFKEQWGFVNSESFPGDLFIHLRSNPTLGAVGPGDPIHFEVAADVTNSKSGYHAVNAAVIKDDPMNLMGATLIGSVKSFRGDWGLLNSERFDGDVFVGTKANKHIPAGGLQQGQCVSFEMTLDEKGQNKLQAINVHVIAGQVRAMPGQMGAMQQPAVGFPFNPAAMGFPGRQLMGMGAHLRMGFGMKPRPEALLGSRCSGTVRNFKDQWGFVISEQFDGDIFLHKGSNPNAGGLQAGDAIMFDIGTQQNGKCHAVNVQACIGAGVGAGVGAGLLHLVGQRCTGEIRKFEDTWGFITSPQYQGDLFIGLKGNPHLTQPLQLGDQVEFTVQRSQKGRSQTGCEAVQVQVNGMGPSFGLGPDAGLASFGGTGGGASRSRSPRPAGAAQFGAAIGAPMGARPRASPAFGAAVGPRHPANFVGVDLTGWIRKFKGEWGFVNSDSFDGDLFMGLKSNQHLLGGTTLDANDKVMFQIVVNQQGKPEATEVQML